MNVKSNKGSITVFVLVGLLFMTGFLIISFGNNVNKSKIAKEQFNIISSIYSLGDGDSSAYERAYTDIRRRNAQVLTSTAKNSNILELTKTFDDKLSNYIIYGNSVQNGTPSPTNPVEVESVGNITKNLFDKSKWKDAIQTTFNGINCLKIKDNNSYSYTVNGDSSTEYMFTFKAYRASGGETKITNLKTENRNVLVNVIHDTKYSVIVYGGETIYFTGWNTDLYIDLSLIQLEKGNVATEYEPYGKYKIPIKVSGKNLFTTDNATIGVNLQADGSATSNSNYNTTDYIPVLANTEYSWSFENNYATSAGTSRRIVAYDENKNIISMLYHNTLYEIGEESVSIETPANAKYVRIGYRVTDTNQVLTTQCVENIYLDEPLRKVGDVADYIDFSIGKVVRNIAYGNISAVSSIYAKYTDVIRFAVYVSSMSYKIDRKNESFK